MRKTTKMKLGAILGAATLFFAGGAVISANETKTTAETTPSLNIKAGNLVFEESSIYLKFAVDSPNIDDSLVELLVWNEMPAAYEKADGVLSIPYSGKTVTVNETLCSVYVYDGFAAKNMTDEMYICAYAEVDGVAYYSASRKYSILEYAYNKLGKTSATASTDEDFKALLTAMLDYGAAAQKYFKDENGVGYNIDRLANADYTYVELSHATLEDGFNYGLYLPNEILTVTIEEGYKLSVGAGSAFVDNGDGTVTLTVPDENVIDEDLFVEEGTLEVMPEGTLTTTTYTFSNYTEGTQYAENEAHVLDENVTVTTTQCHFTSDLRIYSSSTHNGYAIISSANVIETFGFNAGNKVDTLNVYGSTDGSTWELISGVSITSTSYNDYEVEVGGGNWYTYLKLDVEGANQVRIMSITLTTYVSEKTDADKVAAEVNAFALDFADITGATSQTLPTESGEATISWSLAEHANATLTDNVLTTTNPETDTEIVLTATFTVGEATVEQTYTIPLLYQLTDKEKLDEILSSFELGFSSLNGETTTELPTTTEGGKSTISWALTEHANATLADNVLTTTNPETDTDIALTATFTVGAESDTKELTITLKPTEATVDPEPDSTPVTASKTIAELITSEGWTGTTTKQAFNLDEVVSVKVDGGSNSGKAYEGDHIRIYATDSPAGSLTITLAEGYELVSVKVTTKTDDTYAFLYVDGTTTDICNQTVEVPGNSVVLNSEKNGSDGKQVRVTAIEVVYKAVES